MNVIAVNKVEIKVDSWNNHPTGILIANPDTTIVYANLAVEKMTGFSASEIIGTRVPYQWQSIETQSELNACLKSFTKNEAKGVELLFQRKDGQQFWVEQTISPVFRNGVLCYYLFSWIDTNELKHAQITIKQIEEKLRLFMEVASDGFCIWDSELNLIELNEARLKMFPRGTEKKDVVGKNILELAPSLKETGRYDKYLQVIKTGRPFVADDAISGFPASNKRHVTVKAFKVGDRLGMVVSDITEAKRIVHKLAKSGEELHKLYQHVVSLREEEREQLSRQVHDELGQLLAVLKIDLSWVSKNVDQNETQLYTRLESSLELLDKIIELVKSISVELRPQVFGNLGLVDAIEWQAQEFEKIAGIECEVNQKPKRITMDHNQTTLVLRIIREALINIFRHASATQVKVSLLTKDDKLVLKIIDNGKGISKEKIKDLKSLGLIGMREYALAGGGKLNITGEANKGTIVALTMPLSRDKV